MLNSCFVWHKQYGKVFNNDYPPPHTHRSLLLTPNKTLNFSPEQKNFQFQGRRDSFEREKKRAYKISEDSRASTQEKLEAQERLDAYKRENKRIQDYITGEMIKYRSGAVGWTCMLGGADHGLILGLTETAGKNYVKQEAEDRYSSPRKYNKKPVTYDDYNDPQ